MSYDDIIQSHYEAVAAATGTSSSSTMADAVIRERETETIVKFVDWASRTVSRAGGSIRVGDLGCGNGYTLKTLSAFFPQHNFVGIEWHDDMRKLAGENTQGHPVTLKAGDLRKRETIDLPDHSLDIAICQRVLINMLNPEDQRRAIENILKLLAANGVVLFIESFRKPLENLNEARAELGLSPLPAAHHNLYLDETELSHPDLEPLIGTGFDVPANLLSTHYYISRVLHPAIEVVRNEGGFQRNSHFVKFMSLALPPAIGDFAPLKFFAFRAATC